MLVKIYCSPYYKFSYRQPQSQIRTLMPSFRRARRAQKSWMPRWKTSQTMPWSSHWMVALHMNSRMVRKKRTMWTTNLSLVSSYPWWSQELIYLYIVISWIGDVSHCTTIVELRPLEVYNASKMWTATIVTYVRPIKYFHMNQTRALHYLVVWLFFTVWLGRTLHPENLLEACVSAKTRKWFPMLLSF